MRTAQIRFNFAPHWTKLARLGAFGAGSGLLGRSWHLWGRPWIGPGRLLGRSWRRLGRSWIDFGCSLDASGTLLDSQKRILATSYPRLRREHDFQGLRGSKLHRKSIWVASKSSWTARREVGTAQEVICTAKKAAWTATKPPGELMRPAGSRKTSRTSLHLRSKN